MSDNLNENKHTAKEPDGSYVDEEQRDGTHTGEHHTSEEDGAYTDAEITEKTTEGTNPIE